MASVMAYRWHLRERMAAAGMHSTTDLIPKLAEWSLEMHPSQAWRLVSGVPERLNLHVLAALCDILGCTPTEAFYVSETAVRTARRRFPKPLSHTCVPICSIRPRNGARHSL